MVIAAARELGYAPNSVARGLRTGASRTIGVIGPSAGDPFFAEVVVGIEETCYRPGHFPHGVRDAGERGRSPRTIGSPCDLPLSRSPVGRYLGPSKSHLLP